MDVLSSLQMTKRTRNASVIHFFLQERIQYNLTDLSRIQYELTDFLKQDEDGDTTGVSDIGIKLSKVYKLFNTLENLHKESFKRLLVYQFKEITKNQQDKIQPFLNKMIKQQKRIETDKNLDLFEEYLKMNPSEVSEIISKLYSSKEDENIKMFEYWREDEDLKKLSNKEVEKLIKEEIKTPGIIECYKKLVSTGTSTSTGINKKLKTIYSKKEFQLSFKELKDIKELKLYGYTKIKNRWYINKVLQEIIWK
jgi:hypothetical protein